MGIQGVRDRFVTCHMNPVFLILHHLIRFIQFVLALTVIGLYGQYLHAAAQAGVYADGKWVYAVVVGSLSAITCLVYLAPLKSWYAFGWDLVLFILWTAVFGIFGQIYIHANAEGDGGVQQMKNAVWVDLVNMLLWLISTIYGVFMFFFGAEKRTLFTGRAKV